MSTDFSFRLLGFLSQSPYTGIGPLMVWGFPAIGLGFLLVPRMRPHWRIHVGMALLMYGVLTLLRGVVDIFLTNAGAINFMLAAHRGEVANSQYADLVESMHRSMPGLAFGVAAGVLCTLGLLLLVLEIRRVGPREFLFPRRTRGAVATGLFSPGSGTSHRAAVQEPLLKG